MDPQDDIKDLMQYYSSNQEGDRLGRQQLEFVITSSLLLHYIKEENQVLEVGCGSGTYTLQLAHHAQHVTATDMVPALIKQCEESIKAEALDKKVKTLVCDARTLHTQLQDKYDVLLIMGPLYHLIHEHERIELLRTLKTLCKPNGLIVSSFLTRFGFFSYMLSQYPEWIKNGWDQAKDIWEKGYLPQHPRNGSFRGYFSTLEEIQQLHKKTGLELQALHSQDPAIGGSDEIFNRLDDEAKSKWVEVLLPLSSDLMALGSGRSILSIAKNI